MPWYLQSEFYAASFTHDCSILVKLREENFLFPTPFLTPRTVSLSLFFNSLGEGHSKAPGP